ncbi:unnamed protein product, partial [Mesorhabditis spiculigera]
MLGRVAMLNATNAPHRQRHKALSQTGGRRYDSFTLGKRLGSGTFGLVYTATDAKRRPIALKIVKLQHLKSVRATLEPIQVETQSWRASNGHHNVVKLYACKRVGNTFYFSMEEAATDVYTLTTAIDDKQHRLPEPIVQRLMAQALDGLLFIHSQGVIHRDIKPDNMLLSRDGRVLLADFGWSKALPLGEKAMTRGGTAEYLGPECFLDSRSYTHSRDLWALGMCMYEWIVGNNYLLERMQGNYKGYKQKVAFLERNDALFPRCSQSTALMRTGITPSALAVLRGLLAMSPEARLGYSEEDPRKVYAALMDMPFFNKVKQRAIPVEMVAKACVLKRRQDPELMKRDMEQLDEWEKAALPSEYDHLFAQFEWSCDALPETATGVRENNKMPFPPIPDFVAEKVGRASGVAQL